MHGSTVIWWCGEMYFLSMIKLYWMLPLTPEDGEQDKVKSKARKMSLSKHRTTPALKGISDPTWAERGYESKRN